MCQHTLEWMVLWILPSFPLLPFPSRGPVWERERPGDPSGVWRPDADPPGDQAAAPAARHDPGRAAALRGPHHGGGHQEGHGGRVGTGEKRRQVVGCRTQDGVFLSLTSVSFLPSFLPSPAGRSRSAAVGLSLVVPAGSPQKPERAEVRDNGLLVVDYLLVSPEKLAFVFFLLPQTLRWISWEKQVKSLPLNPANNI